ncbi:CBM35 domain-containing protein [Micromonospora sp. WMMD980]|uniref:CBM35 domain-containing protein n=1 Tax=Micromonospora sp. WMMD980 TaxID=3016088 RepID=UPI0024165660|nr:CBM35 domain-containing protein [Micromonospora sp. WMMD980]MDG4803752.1 CBM35 domain-containing protein [Micromonospora sp. WMMD980]
MRHLRRGAPIAAAAIFAGTVLAALLAAPTLAATATLQAENGTLTGGATVATDHAGYRGSGFVGGFTDGNKGSARTSFSVANPTAGQHTLSIRYANGTGSAKTLSLYINGTRAQQLSLAATANWDSWQTAGTTATLVAGTNTIAYAFDASDSGNVNLDELSVAPIPAAPAGRLEAESATLSGGTRIEADHPGYTGAGFVGGYTDGNRGSAATTFRVTAATAGNTPLTLRYANGTGSTKTLSLHVNGAMVQQITLPATANWDTWGTQTVTAALNSGANTVAITFDAADTGNVNLDHLAVGTTTTPTTPPTTPPPGTGGLAFEAESSFYSGGPSVATSVGGYSGAGHLTGFSTTGARVVLTPNLPSAGTRATTVRFSNTTGSTRTLSVYANGVRAGQLTLPAGAGWQTVTTNLTLRAGLNTVTLRRDASDSGDVAIDRINVTGAQALAERGATLPYTEFEAENGATNGTVLAADRTYKTIASESSGRRAVQLRATGQYVRFTLTKPANALTVRYSVPDNTNATLSLYANGSHLRDLNLSSRHAWVYGDYPYNNNPADGNAHRFYDESRTLIGDWPAGTVLTLQKDAGDTASTYTIDLIDTEQAVAGTAPSGYTSAPPPGGGDDTAALTNALNSAKSAGKGLWIPTGTYRISSRINVQGVTIRGAGPWHTTLMGTNGKGGFFATGGNVQIFDLAISGDSTVRNDGGDDAAFEGNFGAGSMLQNILVFHSKVGLWADDGTDGLYVIGMRIRDTYADGVNLNGSVRNTRIDQSSVRNTGDDALAMWSEGSPVTNSAFTFNTLQLPMLANTVGVYGGTSNRVTDNLMSDTVVASAGIAVGTRFAPVPLSGTTVIARNTLTRTGGLEPNWNAQLGALWVYADTADITAPIQITDTTIRDSTYAGVLMSWGRTITGTTFDRVTIENTGTYGIVIDNVTGSATFSNTRVSGTPSGGLSNPGSTFTIYRGAGNSGF